MDNKTARQDLETVIRVEDLALGSMRKLRAIQDWLRAEAARAEEPASVEMEPKECGHENTYRTGLGYIVCYECQKSWHPDDDLPDHLKQMRKRGAGQ